MNSESVASPVATPELEPLLAFTFTNWDEGETFVVFSITERGACAQFDYGCDCFTCDGSPHECGWEVRRAPEYDVYAPGPMTAEN